MSKGIFITGTGTGVGKTLSSAIILKILRDEGIDAVPMKPAQSGAEETSDGKRTSPDIDFVLQMTGTDFKERELLSPYVYLPACSPHLAAEIEDRPVEISKIKLAASKLLESHQLVLAEGAGGALVPINEKLLMTDLMQELEFPIIIVANSQLGTINHTLLTVEALRSRGLPILGLVLSDQAEGAEDDFIANDNLKVLEKRSGVPILMRIPFIKEISPESVSEVATALRKRGAGRKILELLNFEVDNSKLKELDFEHVWHPYTDITRFEKSDYVVFDKSKGSYLVDNTGKKHLDGFSSWWSVNLGHGQPSIVSALQKRAGEIQQCILGDVSHPDAVLAAEELAELAPGDLNRVCYASDGSSAVEAALKIAMQYYWNQGIEGKKKFIYLENSYHGDTLGAVSVGFVEAFHTSLKDFIWPNYQAPTPVTTDSCPEGTSQENWIKKSFSQIEALLKDHANEVAAVIVEPLCQAAGGMRIYHPEYLRLLRAACDKAGVLLIADEIAVGFGRTGTMFACEQAGIIPDMLVLGKSITGGYFPVSAVVTTDKIYDTFRNESESPKKNKTFFHGHTFSGHPLGMACARAAIKIYREEGIIEAIPKKAEILEKGFESLAKLIPGSRSNSLGMISMLNVPSEVGGAVFARAAAKHARANGLFIRSLGDVLYLYPPLTASEEELERMIEILGRGIRHV